MPDVIVTRTGHVLDIEINRPQRHNALSVKMYRDIAQAYGELDRDAELRVGVVHARGNHFTTGVELAEWAEVFADNKNFHLNPGEIDPYGIRTARVRKPIVIAVQGLCFTWGVELMLASDIRIAADDTKFAMLEVLRGIFPCGGATLRLPKEIGWANAQRYLLTGDPWSAQESWRMGLVQEVVPPGKQYEKALEIAQKIARAAPLGVQGALQSAHIAVVQGEAEAAKYLFDELARIMVTQDAAEGVEAFVQRREASFKGN